MLGRHARSYAALILIAVLVSTALTAIAWIWRARTIRLLALQGPDYLFTAAQGQEIISISVTPERKLEKLEFRFRALVTRDPLSVQRNLSRVTSVQQLLESWPPIAERRQYFSAIGAEALIFVHEVPVTNMESQRLVLVDFGKVYSSLFDSRHDNESLTAFAFLINETDHIAGYFEGYSDYLVARVERGAQLRRERLLQSVRVQSGEKIEEYASEPTPDQLSIQHDLPPWGQIAFEKPSPDKPYGATLIVKEGNIQVGNLLVTVETYAEGRWYGDASGYWVIRTGLV